MIDQNRIKLVKKKSQVKDKLPSKKVLVSSKDTPALISSTKDPIFNYNSTTSSRSRTSFFPPEYDLAEIQRIEDVESYVRITFNKKSALMFKEGWDFVGKNPKTVAYIKLRFSQIAKSSKIPTRKLLKDIGYSLIKKSNSFLAKVRDIKASGGKIRVTPDGKKLLPIAGYFPAPAETMEFSMRDNTVVKWQQRMPSGLTKEFGPDEIVHFYYDRKDGFVFGTPTLVPVIDDIRALRKIEENIELLVYQHLFPIFQWIVGNKEQPAGVTEAGEREVDIVKKEIQYMPTEGGIVTTERHEIKAIGAEGRALRAEGYLSHFKKRVFAGLGMSSIDFGEAETSNRSTSETLSQNLIDSVKDFQQTLEMFVDEYIIDELLLESTFGPEVLSPENKVQLKFKEIDIFTQIKKEAHYADQFTKDVITHAESRIGIGREPILIPSPEEIDNGQDGPDKYPEWNQLRWNLIQKPLVLIQALDEPYTQVAKARIAAEEKASAERDLQQAAIDKKPKPKAKDAVITDVVVNKIKNQHLLIKKYNDIKNDLIDYLNGKDKIDLEFTNQLIRSTLTAAGEQLTKHLVFDCIQGYNIHSSVNNFNYSKSMMIARKTIESRIQHYINKLVEDITKTIKRNNKEQNSIPEFIKSVDVILDSFKFRAFYIEDVEPRKAFCLGKAFAAKDTKHMIIVDTFSECDKCKDHYKTFTLQEAVVIDNLPPYHPGCNCKIRLEKIKNVDIEDSANQVKDVIDPAKKERCVLQVKKSLRKEHPDWDIKQLKSVAYKICNSKLK